MLLVPYYTYFYVTCPQGKSGKDPQLQDPPKVDPLEEEEEREEEDNDDDDDDKKKKKEKKEKK